jgi:hypothetical protein
LFQIDPGYDYGDEVTLLYILAAKNMAALIRTQSSMVSQSCLDIEEDTYGTPLFAALATKSDAAALALMESLAAEPTAQDPDHNIITPHEICEMFRQRRSTEKFEWGQRYRMLRNESLFWNALSSKDHVVALFILSLPRYRGRDTVNTKAKNNVTLVGSAAHSGNWALVKRLLDSGADIEGGGPDNWFLLHYAIRDRDLGLVEYLIDRGTGFGKADHLWSLLSFAAQGGDLGILALFLDHWAEIETNVTHGGTLLHHAATIGSAATVRWLLGRGLEVNEKDESGRTPAF